MIFDFLKSIYGIFLKKERYINKKIHIYRCTKIFLGIPKSICIIKMILAF